MELTIEQSCPSCGAAIVLQEDDRLVQCEFCDVRNYKVASGGNRFVLPARQGGERGDSPLIYAPYLRFKGAIFYVRHKQVKHKIVDATRIGLADSRLPVTLGLRPQAMQIKPVVSATGGTFIQQTEPTRTVFTHAARIIDLFNDKSNVATFHRAFIGETISRIYQPYFLKGDMLHDGVDDRPVGERSLLAPHLEQASASKHSWEPQFISTLCPGCGGLLGGERDALVLQCCNCRVLWEEEGGRFVRADWQMVISRNPRARYLPFWKIGVSNDEKTLNSFGDFLRFTNQPIVIRAEHDNSPLTFWVPAFKVNPKTFLQVSAQLTVAQPRIPAGEQRPIQDAHPVTLNKAEGVQAIKSVLAKTTLSREKRFPLLAGMQIRETRCTLVYLPFSSQTTHDLVQEHCLATLQTAAIRYGRAL